MSRKYIGSMSNGLLYAQAVAAEIRGEAAKRRVQAKTIGEALGVSENAISRRMTGGLETQDCGHFCGEKPIPWHMCPYCGHNHADIDGGAA